MALFVQQGFDQTTVAQIAEAAGVSQMTLFRYFPTKDAVIFDDPYDRRSRTSLPPRIPGCWPRGARCPNPPATQPEKGSD